MSKLDILDSFTPDEIMQHFKRNGIAVLIIEGYIVTDKRITEYPQETLSVCVEVNPNGGKYINMPLKRKPNIMEITIVEVIK